MKEKRLTIDRIITCKTCKHSVYPTDHCDLCSAGDREGDYSDKHYLKFLKWENKYLIKGRVSK